MPCLQRIFTDELWETCSVKEVFPDRVVVTLKDPKNKDAKPEERVIDAGFVLWSTGIGESWQFQYDALSFQLTHSSVPAMNPFVKTLVDKLPNQSHKKAIVVDEHLRVKGSPLGTVYCIGDAATVSRCRPDGNMDFELSFSGRSRPTWSITS